MAFDLSIADAPVLKEDQTSLLQGTTASIDGTYALCQLGEGPIQRFLAFPIFETHILFSAGV